MSTRSILRNTVLAAALGSCVLAPPVVRAEQQANDNAAPFSRASRLNFTLNYPRFLFFQVGSLASVDNLLFSVPAANVGDSGQVFATGGNAGVGGRALTINVRGNNGQVTITATNSAPGQGLGTGTAADGFINYSQIATTSDSAQLPAPVLTNAGLTTAQPALNGALVTQRSATWTYAYLNQTVPSSGTYGGAIGARGGIVTYTATMP